MTEPNETQLAEIVALLRARNELAAKQERSVRHIKHVFIGLVVAFATVVATQFLLQLAALL